MPEARRCGTLQRQSLRVLPGMSRRSVWPKNAHVPLGGDRGGCGLNVGTLQMLLHTCAADISSAGLVHLHFYHSPAICSGATRLAGENEGELIAFFGGEHHLCDTVATILGQYACAVSISGEK